MLHSVFVIILVCNFINHIYIKLVIAKEFGVQQLAQSILQK